MSKSRNRYSYDENGYDEYYSKKRRFQNRRKYAKIKAANRRKNLEYRESDSDREEYYEENY